MIPTVPLAINDQVFQIMVMELASEETASRGRPREFDPEEVVERAMNLFWTNGYHGTSLPELLAATGLSRGSLYGAFGSKRGIFLLALDRYIQDALDRFDEEFDATRSAPDGIRACLAGYLERTTGAAGRRGCLVVATAMELAGQDADVKRRLARFFDEAHTRLETALSRAQVEGRLAKGVEPASAARVLLSMVEGMRVIAKTGVDGAVGRDTINALLNRFLK